MIGMALSLGAEVSGGFLWFWLAQNARNSYNPEQFEFFKESLSFVVAGLLAAGQVLVLMAVFSGRQSLRRFAPNEEWLPEGRNEMRRAAVDLPPNAIRE
jgi:hypothetical protein